MSIEKIPPVPGPEQPNLDPKNKPKPETDKQIKKPDTEKTFEEILKEEQERQENE